MKTLKLIYTKYQTFFTHLLSVFGVWGVLLIATVDAVVPVVPLDIVIAGYVYKDPGRFWLYCLLGALGSASGSMVIYWIGRKGGEPLLLKKISHERLEGLRDRYETWESLFVGFNAMLPPPAPMKLVILTAGAFEMHAHIFWLAMFIGRLLRFGILSLLVVKYGPDIVRIAAIAFREHAWMVFGALTGLALLIFMIARYQRRSAKD